MYPTNFDHEKIIKLHTQEIRNQAARNSLADLVQKIVQKNPVHNPQDQKNVSKKASHLFPAE